MFACKLLLSSSGQGSMAGFLEHFNKLISYFHRAFSSQSPLFSDQCT